MSFRFWILPAVALLSAACTSMSSPRPARPTTVAVVAAPAPTASVAIVLTSQHRTLLRSYYAGGPGRGQGRGRGRGRGGGLPRGIAMNLERGKPLPPGIAMQVLPRELIVQLPALPSGLQYAVAAGKLLLIDVATHAVHDVLVDALFD